MDRTERLLDLVALLLGASEPISFAELREHFPDDYGGSRESAERKLERDKAELVQLGVPLEFVPPDDSRELGGYRIERSQFFLEDPHLLPEEAAALYAAGSAALATREFPFAHDLTHALRKIAVAGPGPSAALSGAGSRRLLIVRPGDPDRAGKLHVLAGAIARRKRVHVVYRSAPAVGQLEEHGRRTERDVDPYGLAFRSGAWRLVAWCHLRRAVRVFVVDRIEELRVSEARPNQPDFEIPDGFDAATAAGTRPWEWAGAEPGEVRLRFAPGSELLAERSFDVPLEGDGATVRVTWLDGLLPQVLSHGDRVWVEAPAEARERARAALQRLSEQLAQTPPELAALEPLPSATPPPAVGPKAKRATDPDKRERLRRLLLVVPAARRKPGITVDELARELQLDPSELLQDIDLLGMVGRPPFSPDDLIDIAVDERGRVTVHLDQSFSRPPQLTPLEALALAAAAQEVAPADPAVESALAKLTSALPASARQLYAALATRVATSSPPPRGTGDLLARLRRAAEGRREVKLGYDKEGRGAAEERQVQPHAVLEHAGRWYVYGHDVTRAAQRTFRLDRIREVSETGVTFEDPGPVDAALFDRPELFFPSGAERPMTLRFSPQAAAWALSRYGSKARRLQGGGVEAVIESAQPAYAVSLALSFLGECEVISPPDARAAMADEVRRTLARYG